MVLIDKHTRVVVQGMTGRDGQKATKEMISYSTAVSCGVTPGKGGMEVEGLPVFDSIREAMNFDPKINTSVLYVPPLMVYDAAMEAMDNGIKLLVIITENVPIRDAARLLEYASHKGCRIIGPASIGLIKIGVGKLGSIAGGGNQDMFTKGNVAIISKSGGMCSETAHVLTQQGIGQSIVIGIGGDVLIGTTYADLLPELEKDPDTKALVIYGEIGGSYEEQLAAMIEKKKFTKPVIAFISGSFAQTLEKNLALGHAGAIIEFGKGTAAEKKAVLKKAGVIIADYHYQIPELVKKALGK